jgi:hypothetical protein
MLMIALAGLFLSGYGQAQKPRAVTLAATPAVQQPLFTEYKGVKLGMSAQEVRAKLGNPVLKDDAMDYFIFADGVTAQFVYDTTHAVRTISVDYAGGTGAPEYRAVVGTLNWKHGPTVLLTRLSDMNLTDSGFPTIALPVRLSQSRSRFRRSSWTRLERQNG